MNYFVDQEMFSKDGALVARGYKKSLSDIKTNRQFGLLHIFDQKNPLVIPDRPVAIICAADTLMKPLHEGGPRRIDALNKDYKKYAIVLAGAGHYALSETGLNIPLNDPDAFLCALTNFSIENSHTKAFKVPREDVTYIAASHCAAETLSGNKSTIEHLVENGANVRLYDSFLHPEQRDGEFPLIGTGTGAPPAAIAVMAVLRQRQGLGPLDVKLFGFDGTSQFFFPISELPEDYQSRIKEDDIHVKIGNEIWIVQGTFFDQMKEIAHLKTNYPDLIGKIEVDNPNTLAARIFNTADGNPRMDFSIVQNTQVVPHSGPSPGM